jgi:hypothetical protein
MALLGVTPEVYWEMGAYASDLLIREVAALRTAEMHLRIELAKAQIRATGAKVM